ncbi:hypothetical protein BUQ74_10785 [Leptospira weilii serovar Heyan]|uniref:hypothetical protein n=1 Tax=Leptospira weilii TaxID=28184 RepID=UPI0002BEE1EE|nr:hypothetical protein [Leptospira weilii]EMJ62748.1 hypothetical protein LEP1GSC051_1814 [Leptospira sp. P2653]EMN45024.1 hypothetical protein LEP1GSC086_2704 [Leptospira weilii str. LNT 1234]OMI17350.1 hypothetical protein BUQ74_10785 [Leptospira weilii serovar Heyan]QDK23019.1 hypothetical protein FHG67_10045 [Leptospira weilii]QDK27337.1 hypothetical protein FHG68_12190 [Leptospira weilii]
MFTSHKISSEIADLNQKFLDSLFCRAISKPELVLIIRTYLKRNSGISLPKGRSMGTGSCGLIFLIKYNRVSGRAANLVGADHRHERGHPSLSYQNLPI